MGNGQIQPELLERLAVVEAWMSDNQESIIGTQPGLEPWQFYGSSTRRSDRAKRSAKGDRIYLHLLMKPYDTISVRGVPIKLVKSVRVLADETELHYTTRCAITDSIMNPNPLGELTIQVPEAVIDPYATVIAIDFASANGSM
jgi:alpha-L-fucosidase